MLYSPNSFASLGNFVRQSQAELQFQHKTKPFTVQISVSYRRIGLHIYHEYIVPVRWGPFKVFLITSPRFSSSLSSPMGSYPLISPSNSRKLFGNFGEWIPKCPQRLILVFLSC